MVRFADKRHVVNILSNKEEIRKVDFSESDFPVNSALCFKSDLSH